MRVIRVATIERAIESVELGVEAWGADPEGLSDYERGKADGIDIATIAIENVIEAYAKEI